MSEAVWDNPLLHPASASAMRFGGAISKLRRMLGMAYCCAVPMVDSFKSDTLVKSRGFISVHAALGQVSLALFRQQDPDLIVVDVLGPVLDGFSLTE